MEELAEKEKVRTMQDIQKPLIIPTLDISKREIAYYSSKVLNGNFTYYQNRNIAEAIRSTLALPLLFTPNKVKIDNTNHFMLDGGIMTDTLISPLKQFLNYVVGVTNKFYPKQRKRVNLFTGFTQTFQSMRKSYLFCEEIGYKTTMECAKEHYFDEIEEVFENV